MKLKKGKLIITLCFLAHDMVRCFVKTNLEAKAVRSAQPAPGGRRTESLREEPTRKRRPESPLDKVGEVVVVEGRGKT